MPGASVEFYAMSSFDFYSCKAAVYLGHCSGFNLWTSGPGIPASKPVHICKGNLAVVLSAAAFNSTSLPSQVPLKTCNIQFALPVGNFQL